MEFDANGAGKILSPPKVLDVQVGMFSYILFANGYVTR